MTSVHGIKDQQNSHPLNYSFKMLLDHLNRNLIPPQVQLVTLRFLFIGFPTTALDQRNDIRANLKLEQAVI